MTPDNFVATIVAVGGIIGALAALWRVRAALREAETAQRLAATAASKSDVEALAMVVEALQEEHLFAARVHAAAPESNM